jgi:hypothetical protein
MKANSSLALVMIALSIFASNALAVIKPPYPARPSAPDNVVVISEDKRESVHPAVRVSK